MDAEHRARLAGRRLTHSPVAVGLLAFLRFAPFTLFSLPAGVLADRFDNRRTMMLMQAVSMVDLRRSRRVLVLSGRPPLWTIYVLALLGGAAAVFDAPNRHALTFQLVGRDELPNAVALNASLFNASRVDRARDRRRRHRGRRRRRVLRRQRGQFPGRPGRARADADARALPARAQGGPAHAQGRSGRASATCGGRRRSGSSC